MTIARWLLPAALATGAVCPADAHAQERGAVRGVVVDARTGAPLPLVRVCIGPDRRAITLQGGEFMLCRLDPGPAGLVARASAYEPATSALTIMAGDTLTVRMELSRDSVPEDGTILLSETHVPERSSAAGLTGVLIDGQPFVYSPSGCGDPPPGIPLLERLDRGDIDHIEVIEGPGAARSHGIDVDGALIIITTTRPTQRRSRW